MDDGDKSKQQLIDELNALRQSEAKRPSMVDNAPVFLAVVDREGRLTFLDRYRAGHSAITSTTPQVAARLACKFDP